MSRLQGRRILIAAASLGAVCLFVAAPLLLSTHHHFGEGLSGRCAICVYSLSSLVAPESHTLHSSDLFELGRTIPRDDTRLVREPIGDRSVRAPPLA